jgi:NAD(P)-dependent dehydrogenase (short-subunit alcohol dehydrogenase family)
VAKFGALNYAVNNAGVAGNFVLSADLSLDDWRRVVAINLDGVFYGLTYEIPAILGSGGGAILNISSVFADRGGPTVEYSTAKHPSAGSPEPPPGSTPGGECASTNSSPA